MDWLTFTSNLIRDLGWPLSALAASLFLLYRGPRLVKFVKAVKYGDFEVTIRESFTEARAVVEKVKQEIEADPPRALDPKDKVLQLAEIDPGIAVVEIWRNLEREIANVREHFYKLEPGAGVGIAGMKNQQVFMMDLLRRGNLTESEISLFKRLQSIRNDVAHARQDRTLTMAEVIEFRDFADVLIKTFHQMRQEGPRS